MLNPLMQEALNQASQGRDRNIVQQMLQTSLIAARKVATRHRGQIDGETLKSSLKTLFTVPSVGVRDDLAAKIADAVIAEK